MPDSVSWDEARDRAEAWPSLSSGSSYHRARDIYQKEGRFTRDQVIHFWDQSVQRAHSMNRSGTRASGDTFWLERNDWHSFLEYEAYLNTLIANKPIATALHVSDFTE